MPELNHRFTLGRMNKDADERLVGNGEYRDALNVQVATSDGSDMGTLQNLLGNTDISTDFINFDTTGQLLGDFEYHCVGSIVDGKTDRIYWLLTGEGKDIIAEYDYNTEKVLPVVVDIFNSNIVAETSNGRVLNFDKNLLITGINIIDDFLFWTDNNTEPKQLSISRSKLGCIDPITNAPSFAYASDLYVKTRKQHDQTPPFINVGKLREEHITVVKKSPKTAPKLEMKNTTRGDVDSDGVFGNITTTLTVNEPVETLLDSDGNWTSGLVSFATDDLADFTAGDFLVLTLNQEADPLQEVSEIVLEIIGSVRYHTGANNIPVSLSTMPTTAVPGVSVGVWFRANIVSGNLQITSNTNNFTVKLKQGQSLFKFKFPRFACRYKYTDGQYSAFSPFSEVAFLPSEFDYLPKEGYNLGMVNSVRKLAVKDFVDKKLIPDDVVEIDILYKESNSPIVYTVDTVKRVSVEDGKWDAWNGIDATTTGTHNTTGFLSITSEVIHAVVPSNQLLRSWDNVPRKALAQEIVGNRVVYGNYLQNYNMYNNNTTVASALRPGGTLVSVLRRTSNITVDVKLAHKSSAISKVSAMVPELLNPFNANLYSPAKSIKSLRTYQVGVSYIDEFGRETPVFSSSKTGRNSLQIDKATAHEAGKLKAQLFNTAPQWAKNFKFLIKESSNEYYNLAMDRWYPAQDGNIWLSFPSAERNKLDDETFLILKKRHDSDLHVSDNTKYKVLAIENEAPLFIKTKKVPKKTVQDRTFSLPVAAGAMTQVIGTAALGQNDMDTGFPQPGGTNIIFDETEVQILTAAIEKEGISNWQFRVRHGIGGSSKWYGIQSYGIDPMTLHAKLVSKKKFGADMGVTSPVSWDTPLIARSAAFGDIQIEFAKNEAEDLPEFDGRFFVKVLSDSTIKTAIIGATVTGTTDWTVTNAAISQYINAEPQYKARGVNDWEDGNSGNSKFFGENEDYISISEHALGGHSSAVKHHDIHHVTGGGSGAGGGQSYWGMAANTTNTSSSSSGWFIDKIEAFRPWKSTSTMGWNFAGTNDDSYTLNYATGDYTIWMKDWAGTATSGHQKQLKLTGTGTHSTITSAQNYLNIDANSAQKAVPPSSGGVPHLQSRTTYDYGGITPSKGIDKTDNIIHLSYAGVGNDHSPTGSQGLNSLSQLKTHFDDAAWSNSYVDEIAFIQQITTKGSLWRWKEDPDQIVYRTTGWDASMSLTQAEWNRNYFDSTDSYLGISLYNYTQLSDYLVKNSVHFEAWNFWDGWYWAGWTHHSHFVTAGKGDSEFSLAIGGYAAFVASKLPPSRLAVAINHLADPQFRTAHGEGPGAPAPHWKWPQFTEDYSKAKNKRRRYQFAAAPFMDGNGKIVDDAESGYASKLGDVINNDQSATGNYLPTNDPNDAPHFYTDSTVLLDPVAALAAGTPARPTTDAPGIRPDGVYSSYSISGGDTVPALKTIDQTLVESMAPGSCTFEILEPYIESGDDGGFTTTNPAIWETEPKEDLGLDLYHEVGQIYPVELNETNMEQFAGPIRSDKNLNTKVTCWVPSPSATVNLTTGVTYTEAQAIALGDPTLEGSMVPGSDDIRVVSHERPEIDFQCFDSSGVITGQGTEAVCMFTLDPVTGDPTGPPTGNTWESTGFGSENSVWLEDINGVPLTGDSATMVTWPTQVAPPINSRLIFTREDGSKTESTVKDQAQLIWWTEVTAPDGTVVNIQPVLHNAYELYKDVHNYEVTLPWHNCYSFGNGVESNRIRDDYNQVFIDKGAKVSTVLEEPYLEDRRSSGLIYSGIYNSTSNVNNLNQFIQAEKITKDLNPDGGSIQKLYTRDTNLITICEDKVFKILANKDALYNADGNPQLVATNRVLGEATTFAGDYGISTNPESFAVDSFRMYFTDRVRGVVIRLSQDGITPISSIGMTDWFNDNLVSAKRLVGSFDDKKKEYNLNLGYFDYTTYSVGILASTIFKSTNVGLEGVGVVGPLAPPAPPVYTVEAPGILVINSIDVGSFSIGDEVSGQGIPTGSVITAIDYQGGGEWRIKINQTPLIDDLWALLPSGITTPPRYGNAQLNIDGSGELEYTFPTRITAAKETQPSNTISFSEKNKGWVSFKSFLKESGLSLNNEYFTFKNGMLNQHHTNPLHNNFYGQQFDSSVEVLFNELPGSVKSFGSLNYEGSQSHVTQDLNNSGEYWDNKNKLGWYVDKMHTNLQQGDLHEFKDKEDKWFSQIKGVTTKWLDDGMGGNIDTNEFSYQGIDDNSGVTIVEGGYTSWDCDGGRDIAIPDCTENQGPVAVDVNGNLYKHYDAVAAAANGNPNLQNPSWINYVWMNSANPGGTALSGGQLNGIWRSGFYIGTPLNGGVFVDSNPHINMGRPPNEQLYPCWVNGVDNTEGHYEINNGIALTSAACAPGGQPYVYAQNFSYLWQLLYACGYTNLLTSSGQSLNDAFGSGNLVWELEYNANGDSIFGPDVDGLRNILDGEGIESNEKLACHTCKPSRSVRKPKCKEIPGLSGTYATEQLCLSDTATPCGDLCTYQIETTPNVIHAIDSDCLNGSVHVTVPVLHPSAAEWSVLYEAVNVPGVAAGSTFRDPVRYSFFGDSNSFTLPAGVWTAIVYDTNKCTGYAEFVIECQYTPPVDCSVNFSSIINVADATADYSGCPTNLADGVISVDVVSMSPGATSWSVEYFHLVSGVLTSIFFDDNFGNGIFAGDSSSLSSLIPGDYVLRVSDNANCSLDYSVAVLCVSAPIIVCGTSLYDLTNPVNAHPTSPNCNNGVISWDLAISPAYSSNGAPNPTTVTVTFHESSTPNIPITTTSYPFTQLPLTISNTGLSAGVTYTYTVSDNNGCAEGKSWSAYTCQIVNPFACDPISTCPGETTNIDNNFHLFLETHLPPAANSNGVAVTVGVGTPGTMGNGNPSDGTICNFPACTVTELDLSNGVTGQPAPTPLFGNNGNILTPGSGSLNPGLEAFPDLEMLIVNNQELASLDVSNNIALTHLDCGYQNLTTLDVSQNTALTYLDCAGNALQPLAGNLDVSNNLALVELYCDYNQLTTLDVSQNTALTTLSCSNNNIANLYLGATINLNTLTLIANGNPNNWATVGWVIHVGSAARVLIAQGIQNNGGWALSPNTTFSPL